MSTPSLYANPLWPDAIWDVSGAFVDDWELLSFFDFCKNRLNFEPYHIVHGSPLCAWNSGRVRNHLLREAREINNAVQEYAKREISLYLTFTNLMLREEHLDNYVGNSLCQIASNCNPTGHNSVIIANDVLKNYISRE